MRTTFFQSQPVSLQDRGGARQDVLVLLLQGRVVFAGHAGKEDHRPPDEMLDERLRRRVLGHLTRRAACRRRHGIEIERNIGGGIGNAWW